MENNRIKYKYFYKCMYVFQRKCNLFERVIILALLKIVYLGRKHISSLYY